MVPRISETLRSELMDGELLLYHPERTRVLALNPTSSLIWILCDGKRTLGQIERLLTDAYPDAASRIPEEIDSVVDLLVQEGALELSVEPGPA